jgi:hypothetical protein
MKPKLQPQQNRGKTVKLYIQNNTADATQDNVADATLSQPVQNLPSKASSPKAISSKNRGPDHSAKIFQVTK